MYLLSTEKVVTSKGRLEKKKKPQEAQLGSVYDIVRLSRDKITLIKYNLHTLARIEINKVYCLLERSTGL